MISLETLKLVLGLKCKRDVNQHTLFKISIKVFGMKLKEPERVSIFEWIKVSTKTLQAQSIGWSKFVKFLSLEHINNTELPWVKFVRAQWSMQLTMISKKEAGN